MGSTLRKTQPDTRPSVSAGSHRHQAIGVSLVRHVPDEFHPRRPPSPPPRPRPSSREPLQTRKAPPPGISDKRSYAEMASAHLILQIQREARAQRPTPKPLLHTPEQPPAHQANPPTQGRSHSWLWAPAYRAQPLGIQKPSTSSPGTPSSYSPSHRRTSDILHQQFPQIYAELPFAGHHRDTGRVSRTKPEHRRPSRPRRGTTRLGEPRHRDRHAPAVPVKARPSMPPPKAMPVTQPPQTRQLTATPRASAPDPPSTRQQAHLCQPRHQQAHHLSTRAISDHHPVSLRDRRPRLRLQQPQLLQRRALETSHHHQTQQTRAPRQTRPPPDPPSLQIKPTGTERQGQRRPHHDGVPQVRGSTSPRPPSLQLPALPPRQQQTLGTAKQQELDVPSVHTTQTLLPSLLQAQLQRRTLRHSPDTRTRPPSQVRDTS